MVGPKKKSKAPVPPPHAKKRRVSQKQKFGHKGNARIGTCEICKSSMDVSQLVKHVAQCKVSQKKVKASTMGATEPGKMRGPSTSVATPRPVWTNDNTESEDEDDVGVLGVEDQMGEDANEFEDLKGDVPPDLFVDHETPVGRVVKVTTLNATSWMGIGHSDSCEEGDDDEDDDDDSLNDEVDGEDEVCEEEEDGQAEEDKDRHHPAQLMEGAARRIAAMDDVSQRATIETGEMGENNDPMSLNEAYARIATRADFTLHEGWTSIKPSLESTPPGPLRDILTKSEGETLGHCLSVPRTSPPSRLENKHLSMVRLIDFCDMNPVNGRCFLDGLLDLISEEMEL